jgi:hypothetical protein
MQEANAFFKKIFHLGDHQNAKNSNDLKNHIFRPWVYASRYQVSLWAKILNLRSSFQYPRNALQANRLKAQGARHKGIRFATKFTLSLTP